MANTDRARAALGLATAPKQGETSTDVAIRNRSHRLEAMKDQYQLAMPDGYSADQLLRDAVTALRQNPDLAQCTEASFFGGLMTAAQLGLRVGVLGHGWLIPFKEGQGNDQKLVATWVLGYQGMIELIGRTGVVKRINAETIRANDKYRIQLGSHAVIEHEPAWNTDRGDPILHYAIAETTNGGEVFFVMDEQDVDRAKARSKSSNNRRSPWNTDRDAMARKTAVRQLFKWLPKSAVLAAALDADEAVREDVTPDGLDQAAAQAQSVTVERVAEPAADGPAEPAVDGTGDPGAAPVARQPIESTKTREEYFKRIVERHGSFYPTVCQFLFDEVLDPATLTTTELRQVADFDSTEMQLEAAEPDAPASE